MNLFWAIERMKRAFAEGAQAGESVEQLKARLRAAADRIHDEDVASCRAIGRHGAAVVPDEARILTHCNAGRWRPPATAPRSASFAAPSRPASASRVLADETRPFLQGSRLTAWELVRDGIDTTVITDNMAGAMMRAGTVDMVVVGADRIAANGDTANKIGTYSVAVLAREHGIPFYVAAPWSTIDLATPDGAAIPDRGAREPRGDARRHHAGGARRREGAQPVVRRHAGEVHHRDHHRARRLPSAVRASWPSRPRPSRLIA